MWPAAFQEPAQSQQAAEQLHRKQVEEFLEFLKSIKTSLVSNSKQVWRDNSKSDCLMLFDIRLSANFVRKHIESASFSFSLPPRLFGSKDTRTSGSLQNTQ